MKRDSRLSGMLHILIHLAEAEAPVPSEKLALAMQTNAVVVRRVMAGLRDAGLVSSSKGHGGGWVLARDPAQVSLRDGRHCPAFPLQDRSAGTVKCYAPSVTQDTISVIASLISISPRNLLDDRLDRF